MDDKWGVRVESGARKKGVGMDSRGVKITSYCAVRWRRFRTADPFAALYFLHHCHPFTAHLLLLLLLLLAIQAIRLAAGVSSSPPSNGRTGASSHLRSVVAYGRKAGTNTLVQHWECMPKEAEVFDFNVE